MRGGFGRQRGGSHSGGGFNMGGGNMQQMLRQAQRMQEEMQKEQEEINETVFEATSGGGAVVIKMKGDRTLQSIEIQPEVVDPDDVEMLQDLIIAAFNDASVKIDEMTHEKMDKYSAALGG
ncbi:MAG: YbaB/EbfC family nucleoid-associated protein [Clostridia bacterium]|nr:YbaB/EbfC family nucleoid-associated protein [Clostridia bacterium]MCR5693432.1 YbaB/EbfC family nucleoid-associated protein [Clostridia bacterium]